MRGYLDQEKDTAKEDTVRILLKKRKKCAVGGKKGVKTSVQVKSVPHPSCTLQIGSVDSHHLFVVAVSREKSTQE